MEQPVLAGKHQFPTEEVIYSHIGKSKALWLSLFEYIHESHPDFTEQWRYYLDGKSWLMKVTRKSRTIFWLSIAEGSFRTTFYFGDKAGDAILKSSLSEGLKRQYRDGKRYGKIRGITLLYRNKRDVESARQLIEIKNAVQ
jgi:hypothetical protein